MAQALDTLTPAGYDVPLRGFKTVNVTNASGIIFDMGSFRAGAFRLPSGGNTSWTFSAAATETGTYSVIQSIGTSGVLTATANAWNDIPAAAFGPRFVKLTPGADVNNVDFSFRS